MSLDYIVFGKKVKKMRTSMKLSQVNVYKETGISVETQRILENGKREPKITTLERLSEFYKTNLLFLLDHSRTSSDLFSELLIDETNDLLSSKDFGGFRDRIGQLISEIEQLYTKDQYGRNNLEYINYLRSFKDIQFDDIHDKENNTTNLKQVLFYLSKSRTDYLSDANLYNIEVQVGIYLAILARQKDDLQESHDLLQRIIQVLEQHDALTTLQNNALVAAYLNLSYYYFRIHDHHKTLEVIDQILMREKTNFKRILFNELQIRKAMAYYHLEDPRYKPILTAIVLNETPKRAKYYKDVMMNVYGISIDGFMVD